MMPGSSTRRMSQPFSITRPDVVLRSEALIVLTAACVAYGVLYPRKWWIFALLFLAPDLSLLGFLGGKDARADRPWATLFYNTVHSYVLPLALAITAWQFNWVWGGRVALIWISHIAFDRLLGYGLKFSGSFKHTHIQSSASL